PLIAARTLARSGKGPTWWSNPNRGQPTARDTTPGWLRRIAPKQITPTRGTREPRDRLADWRQLDSPTLMPDRSSRFGTPVEPGRAWRWPFAFDLAPAEELPC